MSKKGKCNEDLSGLDLWLRTADDLKNGHFGLRFSFLVKVVFCFLNRQRARMHVHDILRDLEKLITPLLPTHICVAKDTTGTKQICSIMWRLCGVAQGDGKLCVLPDCLQRHLFLVDLAFSTSCLLDLCEKLEAISWAIKSDPVKSPARIRSLYYINHVKCFCIFVVTSRQRWGGGLLYY